MTKKQKKEEKEDYKKKKTSNKMASSPYPLAITLNVCGTVLQ